MARWDKGISGNPKGRPKKERTFTALLERAGKARTNGATKQKAFVERVWGAVDTGVLAFADGKQIELTGREYLDLTKFLFSQIDGPPKQEHELSAGDGASMTFVIGEGRPSTDDGDSAADKE